MTGQCRPQRHERSCESFFPEHTQCGRHPREKMVKEGYREREQVHPASMRMAPLAVHPGDMALDSRLLMRTSSERKNPDTAASWLCRGLHASRWAWPTGRSPGLGGHAPALPLGFSVVQVCPALGPLSPTEAFTVFPALGPHLLPWCRAQAAS